MPAVEACSLYWLQEQQATRAYYTRVPPAVPAPRLLLSQLGQQLSTKPAAVTPAPLDTKYTVHDLDDTRIT